MIFPTIDECIALRGEWRGLLHELDHNLRGVLAATQDDARVLGLATRDVAAACATVLMSVAADAALNASGSGADVTDADFSAAACDALTWAQSKTE
jgi:hypothetical protein